MPVLEQRLERGEVVLMDGATGTELQARGVPMDAEVWSGRALLESPGVLREIHQDYIRAGAQVITANTFSCNRYMLEPIGMVGDLERLNREAVAVARAARRACGDESVAVAGSISGFMSRPQEPRWRQPETVSACVREQAELLAEAGADLLLLEMMEQVEFLQATWEAASSTGLPVWIGVSAVSRADGTLGVFDFPERDLAPLLDASVATGARVINVMHTPVRDVAPAVAMLTERFDGFVGAVPNAGRFEMPDWKFERIVSPEDLSARARGWVESGVRVLGGCCGLGPAHIRALDAVVDATRRPG